jgi:hypothetical protein
MIVSGASVPAAQFRASSLFDQIIDGDLLAGAVSRARSRKRTSRASGCAM